MFPMSKVRYGSGCSGAPVCPYGEECGGFNASWPVLLQLLVLSILRLRPREEKGRTRSGEA